MPFTKRQTILLDRLEALAVSANRFPNPIVEIWGGGSLFRLEPSPKDADCVFRFETQHSLWGWFIEIVEKHDADILKAAKAGGLESFSPDEQDVIRWWCEAFSYRDLDGMFNLIESLSQRLTTRLIKKHFPRISVVQLTNASEPNAWRMTLTKAWEAGTTFDREKAVSEAGHLQEADRNQLLQQLAEFNTANQLLKESILEGDEAKFYLASSYAGEPGPKEKPEVAPAHSIEPTADLRKRVKEATLAYDALRAAAQAGSVDPTEIALGAMTSKQKIKKWSKILEQADLITPKYTALARHNAGRRDGGRDFDSFRLVTDLHERGCLVQREGECFWFFTDGAKGLIVFSEWRGPFSLYSHSVLLTTLDDEREFFEWPVYRKTLPSGDELWALVESIRAGDEIESSPPLFLKCPFCGRNAVCRGKGYLSEYGITDCSHLVDMQIEYGDNFVALGNLSEHANRESFLALKGKHAIGVTSSAGEATASALFVSSTDFGPPDFSAFDESESLENNTEYQALCDAYLERLTSRD